MAAATALVSVSSSADAQVHRFDMGPEDSPVWPRFELVTAEMTYSPERGFGWVSEGKIVARRNFQPRASPSPRLRGTSALGAEHKRSAGMGAASADGAEAPG